MEPITRDEMFLAAAAGEYDGELPEPVTRNEYFLKKIIERIEEGSAVKPEDIDAAIEAYLNSHDADIVTEQELTQALAGYYDKGDIDDELAGKADANHNHTGVYAAASHSHAQSDITDLDTTLAGKVDKDGSKVLTDLNYSSTDKAKVDGAIQSSEKGANNGVAELDANGKVPSSQLPSFVDDVLEYADVAHFPQTGESGKIYIAVDTNLSYRWTGSAYGEISPSLALGETSSTAYRGDWGKATKDAVGNIQSLQTADKSSLVAAINELKSTSVSAVPDKGLSTNDYTTAEKNKLRDIEAGAEVNVQSDWNQTDSTADDFIKNKPDFALASDMANALAEKAAASHSHNAAVASSGGSGGSSGYMTGADKEKLNNVNAGQMVYLSESTAKILTDSPRSLSESLLNYKIIEVRYLQLEETISGTTYQTWGWARLIKNSSGDFMSAPVIHFISNGSTLTIKAYEIGILSANPTQLALTRDTSGSGLWTGAIIGYK